MKKLVLVLVLLVVASTTYAQDRYLEPYLEILRKDARAEKVAIITDVMDFTDEEAAKFWPVYKKYENELKKMNDVRLDLIKDYAKNYWDMSDQTARDLMKTAIELQIKEAYLKKEYFRKFEQALSSKRAAKFMQLENQIDILVDLQIATELPLIE
jgi:excinuclease UvrABC ATPase subunit